MAAGQVRVFSVQCLLCVPPHVHVVPVVRPRRRVSCLGAVLPHVLEVGVAGGRARRPRYVHGTAHPRALLPRPSAVVCVCCFYHIFPCLLVLSCCRNACDMVCHGGLDGGGGTGTCLPWQYPAPLAVPCVWCYFLHPPTCLLVLFVRQGVVAGAVTTVQTGAVRSAPRWRQRAGTGPFLAIPSPFFSVVCCCFDLFTVALVPSCCRNRVPGSVSGVLDVGGGAGTRCALQYPACLLYRGCVVCIAHVPHLLSRALQQQSGVAGAARVVQTGPAEGSDGGGGAGTGPFCRVVCVFCFGSPPRLAFLVLLSCRNASRALSTSSRRAPRRTSYVSSRRARVRARR